MSSNLLITTWKQKVVSPPATISLYEIWNHMALERIDFEPIYQYKVQLLLYSFVVKFSQTFSPIGKVLSE